MAFGKLGARGGFGSLGVLGRAGGSLPVVLPLYTGQLATRSMLMDDKLSFGATNQMMARSRHIARTNITSLAIVIPTWYFSHADGSEVALGGTATATASIEYPIGTFTQIKFGGSVTGTLPDNSNNVSDQTAVVIPTGAVFFVRMFWQSAAGFVLRNANDVGIGLIPQWGSDATNGEGFMQAASGLTDMTMGGTVTNVSNGTNGWCPVAIVGPTTAPSIFLLGDSRMEGYGDSYSDASTNIGYGRLVGPSFGNINAGIFALSTGQYIASHTLKNQLAGYCSHVWFELGYNDFGTGGSLPTFLTNQQTIISYFPGKPVIASTVPPGTTSTDAWATTANQTLVSAPGNTSRLSYNNSLRSGSIANLAGYFELADIAEGTRDSGKWIVNGTANYATGDGVHEKPVMNNLYLSGGAFKTSLIKGPPPALLDALSVSASAAYSTRKLRTAYAGSAIRVQRSSDSTQSDIGFAANGQLNTTALLAFVGAGNGDIITWYDQSGNGVNTASALVTPRIVNAGALDTLNGNAAIRFGVAAARNWVVCTPVPAMSQPTTIALAAKSNSQVVGGHFTDGLNAVPRQLIGSDAGPTHYQMYAGTAALAGGTLDLLSHEIIGIFNGASSSVVVDGVTVMSGNPGTDGVGSQTIGGSGAGATAMDGWVGEYLLFNSVLNGTDQSKIRTSWQTQWGTP